ncbi:MAG: flagellar hook-length control protein FliK [Oscillospiraceae bacterium]|nr:flagellar hook-length control protein FliK [Oscillospiraceae bacterium]
MTNINLNSVANAIPDLSTGYFAAANAMWAYNARRDDASQSGTDGEMPVQRGDGGIIGFSDLLFESRADQGGERAAHRTRDAIADLKRYGAAAARDNQQTAKSYNSDAGGATRARRDGNPSAGYGQAGYGTQEAGGAAAQNRQAADHTERRGARDKGAPVSGERQGGGARGTDGQNARGSAVKNGTQGAAVYSGEDAKAANVAAVGAEAHPVAEAVSTDSDGAGRTHTVHADMARGSGGSAGGDQSFRAYAADAGLPGSDAAARRADYYDGAKSAQDGRSQTQQAQQAAQGAASAIGAELVGASEFSDMVSDITGESVLLNVVDASANQMAANEGIGGTGGTAWLDGVGQSLKGDETTLATETSEEISAYVDANSGEPDSADAAANGAAVGNASAAGEDMPGTRVAGAGAGAGGTAVGATGGAESRDALQGGAATEALQGAGGAIGEAGFGAGAHSQGGGTGRGDAAQTAAGTGVGSNASANASENASGGANTSTGVAAQAETNNAALSHNAAFASNGVQMNNGGGGGVFAGQIQRHAPAAFMPEFYENLAREAKIMLQGDKYEFMMQLKPESLGKVAMRILTENGVVSARFTVESEQARSALEENLGRLRDTFVEQGLDVQGFFVEVRQGGGREAHSDGADYNSNRYRAAARGAGDGVAAAALDAGRQAFLRNQYYDQQSSVHYTA